MAQTTKIEWADCTWTPIRARLKLDCVQIAKQKGYGALVDILTARKPDGSPRVVPGESMGPHCEKVSPECLHCYSGANNHRALPRNGTGLPFDRRARDLVDVFVDPKILVEPLRWRKPRVIFVCSQTDLYGEFVPDEMIDQVKAIEALAPRHFFLELTKRSERMRQYHDSRLTPVGIERVFREAQRNPDWVFASHLQGDWWPLPHVGLGVSAGTQQYGDLRVPDLMRTEAALRFVSYEPALGGLDFGKIVMPDGDHLNTLHNHGEDCGIDWVIAGGESGPRARPPHQDWFRRTRDQCHMAAVPFLFKQWGAWLPSDQATPQQLANLKHKVRACPAGTGDPCVPGLWLHTGKKAAGRLLDGQTWDDVPALITEHLKRTTMEIANA